MRTLAHVPEREQGGYTDPLADSYLMIAKNGPVLAVFALVRALIVVPCGAVAVYSGR